MNAGSRHLRASSPPNRNGGKYIQEESPFERLKNEVQSEFGNYQQQGDMSSVSQVESIINQNRREKEKEDWNDDNDKGKGRDLGDYSESAIDSPPQISGPSRNNRVGGVGRTSSSPKKLLNKVLTAEQRKASGIGASRTGLPTKIQATTPRGPARIDRNPFTSQSNNNGGKQSRDSLDSNPSPNKWNGIADLRKTPLTGPSTKSKSKTKASSPKKKSSAAAVGNEWDSDSDEDGSLAWPPGMSPPVTMQFSVPRSKYLKTPAKEAAKMVVEDLLRTVGGTSPALREREKKEKELKMSLRKPSNNFNESSSTSSRLLTTSRNQDVGGKKSSAFPSGPVNTPLKKSTKEKVREIRNLDSNSTKGNANRRRDSMPTPPSITRHISVKDSENSISSSSSNAPRQSTTPSVAPGRQASVVPGSVASNAGSLGGKSASSKLMDQDEDGADDDDDDDEVPENLGTKLSKVALGTSSAGVDKLLEYGNVSREDFPLCI